MSVLVALADITIPEGRRALGDVGPLVESIRESGLLCPIIVTPSNVLIAGRHRLEAARVLGWESIPATVLDVDALHRKLIELDENLVRNELTALERSKAIAERKRIYEELHPEAAAGAMRANGMHRALGHNVAARGAATFTEETAAKLGVAERTVREDVQIGSKIVENVRDSIRDLPIANQKRKLLALSRLAPEEQRKSVAAMVASAVPVGPGGEMPSVKAVPMPVEDTVERPMGAPADADAGGGGRAPGSRWYGRLVAVAAAVAELDQSANRNYRTVVRYWKPEGRAHNLQQLRLIISELQRWETALVKEMGEKGTQ